VLLFNCFYIYIYMLDIHNIYIYIKGQTSCHHVAPGWLLHVVTVWASSSWSIWSRTRCDIGATLLGWSAHLVGGRDLGGTGKPCGAYNGGQKVKIFKMFVAQKNNLASYIYIWDVMGLKKKQLGGAVGVINWYNFGGFTNKKLGWYSPHVLWGNISTKSWPSRKSWPHRW
jgi:hypothetical protein